MRSPTSLGRKLTDCKQILVVQNEMAGRGRVGAIVQSVARRLSADGFAVEHVRSLDELERAAGPGRPAASQLRAVISAGGDGTATAVVNCTPPGTPILLIPAGTENLLARHLRMTADPDFILRGAEARQHSGIRRWPSERADVFNHV